MARPFLQQKFECSYCRSVIWRHRSQISDGAIGPLAGLKFCGRECQKLHFRGIAKCVWPGCCSTKLVESRNFRIKASRGWFCDDHLLRMERMTGSRKVTARKIEFIGGKPLDHNRITWHFVKFVIFERDCGVCRGCGVRLEFKLRPIKFHIDHILPVWQGGKTSEPNLQLLCLPCHKKKSSQEQKSVNQTRWQHRVGAHFARMTHTEKDALISKLLTKISDLETRVPNYSGEKLNVEDG